jgi:predicted nucleic acid-binding protein
LEQFITAGLSISIITYAEIYQGIYFGRNATQREADFQKLLNRVDVITVSQPIARRLAKIRGALQQQGLPLPISDVLIAATAIEGDLELVTRNLRHYQRIPDLKLNVYSQKPTTL